MKRPKHGLGEYQNGCRCSTCKTAYQSNLTRRAKARREGREKVRSLPSVTNTLVYDTMTPKQFRRLRYGESSNTT